MKTKYCKNCGRPLDGGRYDRVFCDDRCGAAYHRAGTPDYAHSDKTPGRDHAQKERTTHGECDWCGADMPYNEYADREGQRVPQYHSNACRQAAYRERKRNRQGVYTDAREKAQAERKRSEGKSDWSYTYDFHADDQVPPPPPPPPPPKKKLSWEDVLGVSYDASWADVTRAWKELVQKWHPDRNRDQEAVANEKLKDINEAYQALKKRYGKNVKQDRH